MNEDDLSDLASETTRASYNPALEQRTATIVINGVEHALQGDALGGIAGIVGQDAQNGQVRLRLNQRGRSMTRNNATQPNQRARVRGFTHTPGRRPPVSAHQQVAAVQA